MSKMRAAAVCAVFLLGLAVSVPIRMYLVMRDIDPSTGFYKTGGTLVTALNAVLAVSALLILVLVLVRGKKTTGAQNVKREGPVFPAVLGFGFLFEAGYSFYQMMAVRGGVGAMLSGLAGVCAAAYFFLAASAAGRRSGERYPIAALFPVVWAVIHLMVSFMHYTTVINISEYLYDMLKMVFVMIFFYYYARYEGGVSNAHEIRGMAAFGLPAVIFTAVSVLPRYLALIGGVRLEGSGLPDDLLFILIACVILKVVARVSAPVFRRGDPA